MLHSITMVSQRIPSSYIRMVARELEGSATTHQLLAGTGLDEISIGLTDSLSLGQFLRILRNAGRTTANPAIGLQLGSLLHPSTHGSVGWATINSPTLGDAIAVLSQYLTLQVPFMQYENYANRGWFSVRITPLSDLEDQGTVLTECALLLLHQVVSYVNGHALAETQIAVDYARPAYAEHYHETFKCPVTFEQGVVEYRFPLAYKDLPSANANESMYEIALDQCRNAARRLQDNSDLSAEIHDLLEKHIADHLTLEQIAFRLNLSPRTLIRRLKKQQTSFQSISDHLYAQTAADYLKRTDISVNAVSQLLGYRDAANFRRSFKRWFHMSPSDYRKQQ